MAAQALADAARRDGLRGIVHAEAITAEATVAGADLGRWIHAEIARHRLPGHDPEPPVDPLPLTGVLHLWRSETTVQLPDDAGSGGRAQQFALAAAQSIGDLEWDEAATVMVAATDGRDGPTDAAGAVVHAGTLRELRSRGIDAQAALSQCDAYPALDAVRALLRTGRTGTNVADVVAVWLWNWY
jgi:hydroxypyruvate reductase